MRKTALAATALALIGAQGGPVRSQDVSPDSIVHALRPSATDPGTTRGIRPIGPAQGGPAQGAISAYKEPRAVPGKPPSVSLNVDFASGSDELRPQAMKTLDALGRALTGPELSSYKFRIDGHTDTVGSDDLNKALSERRAQAVANYLSDKFQVSSGRMEVVGSGKQGLAVQTGDNVPEARNRRVEVVNLGS